jgi:hypothetical protein
MVGSYVTATGAGIGKDPRVLEYARRISRSAKTVVAWYFLTGIIRK